MSSPSELELRRLGQIADDLRETFSERAHRIDVAVGVDPYFGTGGSPSALRRELVNGAVTRSASAIGFDFRSVCGSGKELRSLTGNVDRRYRIRRGARRADSSLHVKVNTESALTHVDDEGLFPVEQWAFVWTVSSENQIEEVIIAEVTGHVAGKPGFLMFGALIPLGEHRPIGGSNSFEPVDEDLPGFDDGDADGGFGQNPF